MKLKRFIISLHRDLGYLFFGMTIIYALSGIALNHMDDWNPSYIINSKQVAWNYGQDNISKDTVLNFLAEVGEEKNYKKHYFPQEGTLTIFLEPGSSFITVNLKTGDGIIQKIKSRPLFRQMNYLHYNHIKKLWTWYADIFAVALILLAFTGLFIIKGKNGITGRGAWLTSAGVIIPIVMFYLYT